MLELNTPQLHLRQIQPTDWPLFAELQQEPTVMKYVGDPLPFAELEMKFTSRLPPWQPGAAHWLCLVVIEKDTQRPVGITGFLPDETAAGQAEVGFMLLPDHQGKGYGTASLSAVVGYARQIGMTALTATVTEGNDASCRVLEKCGFAFVERIPDAYEIGGRRYADLIYRCPLNRYAA
ncbi:GNAT family N-acetyltransferase [Photobacterium sp. TY1-4]|uniref:GNAT family N-acetyltransferase n=1 Tax=Photobacterium sp. TY1-4 TaxID=2899122 RepID=UPI0021BFABFC|nr:GNAT family N-acetyltransferase [Photobacterium sp. TY1-4]UXI03178.1 GNAT family N-acetyltransferase [Photobacterium sp. TY1-4]